MSPLYLDVIDDASKMTKQESVFSDCLEENDLVGYQIENSPDREMSQSQR
jgi:hypothetical protein